MIDKADKVEKKTRGLFITLEGGDGAGKSTQIENITRFFEAKGLVVVHSREPGGTKIGELLRTIVLDKSHPEMEDVTEMFLYAAGRAQHTREFIIPALERGEIVICDRYVDSSIAYQGYGRELGEMVAEVNRYATGGLAPDLTFWMDIDPEAGRARVSSRATGDIELDRLELEKLDFHYRTYEGFRKISESEPDRVKRIDATRTVEEISAEIYSILEQVCAEKGFLEGVEHI